MQGRAESWKTPSHLRRSVSRCSLHAVVGPFWESPLRGQIAQRLLMWMLESPGLSLTLLFRCSSPTSSSAVETLNIQNWSPPACGALSFIIRTQGLLLVVLLLPVTVLIPLVFFLVCPRFLLSLVSCPPGCRIDNVTKNSLYPTITQLPIFSAGFVQVPVP